MPELMIPLAVLGVVLAGLIVVMRRRLRRARAREATVRARLAAVIEATDAGLSVWDADGRLSTCNDRFRSFYPSVALTPELQFEDLIRYTATRAVVVVPDAGIDAWIERWLRAFRERTAETARTPDDRWIDMRTGPTAAGETLLLLADVTDARTAATEAATRQDRATATAAALALLRDAARLGHEASSFHGAARDLLTSVVEWGDWSAATVYLVASDDSARLVSTGLWAVASEPAWPLARRAAVDACTDHPDEVWRQVLGTGRPVWIGNLRIDPRPSEVRQRALEAVRALCALPVRSDDRVVAVVELYGDDARAADPDRQALLGECVGQLAHVFAREAHTA